MDNYARMRLAEIYISEERNLEEAKQLLEVIKSADPKFLGSERCEMLGDIEYTDAYQNYEAALMFYKEASEINSNRLGIYLKLGRTYEKIRDYEDAIANYKKALRRNKNDFTSNYKLGLVLIKNNQKKEGIEVLLKSN